MDTKEATIAASVDSQDGVLASYMRWTRSDKVQAFCSVATILLVAFVVVVGLINSADFFVWPFSSLGFFMLAPLWVLGRLLTGRPAVRPPKQ